MTLNAQAHIDQVMQRLAFVAKAAGTSFTPPPLHETRPSTPPPPPPPAPSTRSPAQQQASRLNGARSRGPVTDAGKAAAAANSTVHGIFSKLIRPARDARDYDALFDHTARRLRQQFPARSLEADLLLDHAAHLTVQLARALAVYNATALGPMPHKPSAATIDQHRRSVADAMLRFRFARPDDTVIGCLSHDARSARDTSPA